MTGPYRRLQAWRVDVSGIDEGKVGRKMKGIGTAGLCLALALAASAVGAPSALAFTGRTAGSGAVSETRRAAGSRKGTARRAPKWRREQKYEWYPAFGPNGKGEEKLVEPAQALLQSGIKRRDRDQAGNGQGRRRHLQKADERRRIHGPENEPGVQHRLHGLRIGGAAVHQHEPESYERWRNPASKNSMGSSGSKNSVRTAAKDKIANVFSPAAGEMFTEFECSGLKLVVKGEVMVPIKSNMMVTVQTVKFAATKGKQKPEKFATDPTGTKRVLFAKNSKLGRILPGGADADDDPDEHG